MENENLILHYNITEDDLYKKQNHENIERIKELLLDVGVWFDIEDGRLYLGVLSESYNRAKKRNAGKRKRIFRDESKEGYKYYSYADIVFMAQSMTDREICEKTGIPQATFYRHKKRLKESQYYKILDKNKLGDIEYLKSVKGNYYF